MTIIRVLALIPALAMGGCALLREEAPSSSTATDALKATQAAVLAYADVFQPAIITYGRLPPCPQAVLCSERVTIDKLKAIDLATTKSIVAAQKVLDGDLGNGTELTAAVSAITVAEQAIISSGIFSTVKPQ